MTLENSFLESLLQTVSRRQYYFRVMGTTFPVLFNEEIAVHALGHDIKKRFNLKLSFEGEFSLQRNCSVSTLHTKLDG